MNKEKLKHIGGIVFGWSVFLGLVGLAVFFRGGHGGSAYGDDGEYYEEKESKIKDGTHSATVDYYNPETGHKASYNLEVEVEDGEVNTIYFPKGGRLDDSHISPTELDEDGNASVEDDEGRNFEISIDDDN